MFVSGSPPLSRIKSGQRTVRCAPGKLGPFASLLAPAI